MTDGDRLLRSYVALGMALLLLRGICYSQSPPAGISKAEATRVALAAAGCKKPQDCIANGRKDKANWVFVITYVAGHDAAGEPLTKPGGWMGVTVDPNGHVIDKMQGD
jgi:hypothetical protein